MGNMYVIVLRTAAYVLISLFNIISNSLLIYGLHRSKQLKNFSNKLILALSCSDLCLGVIVFPFFAVNSIQRIENQALKAVLFMATVFTYTSGALLICIAADRYMHITKPRLYRSDVSGSRLALLVVCCVLFAAAIAASYMLLASFWQHLAVAICNTIAICGSTILYFVIFKNLKKHQLNVGMRQQQPNNNSNNNSNNNGIRDGDSPAGQLSAVRTIRLVLVAIFLCYVPQNIILTVLLFYQLQLKVQPGEILQVLVTLSTFLAFSASAINSVIIIFGNLRCRRVITSLCRKMVVENA